MRIVLTGAGGFLGTTLRRAWAGNHEIIPWTRRPLADVHRVVDVTDRTAVLAAMRAAKPDAVVHCAAMARTGECAAKPEASRQTNVLGTAHVAEAAQDVGARLAHLSTDLVFDGLNAPYAEDARPRPLSVYGVHKLESEAEALRAENAVVCRISLLLGDCGPQDPPSAMTPLFAAMRDGGRLTLFEDEWRTPLFAADVSAGLELALGLPRGAPRILHLAGGRRLSRLELGELATRVYERESGRKSRAEIIPARQKSLGDDRPPDVSLDIELAHSLGFAPGDFEARLAETVRASLRA